MYNWFEFQYNSLTPYQKRIDILNREVIQWLRKVLSPNKSVHKNITFKNIHVVSDVDVHIPYYENLSFAVFVSANLLIKDSFLESKRRVGKILPRYGGFFISTILIRTLNYPCIYLSPNTFFKNKLPIEKQTLV